MSPLILRTLWGGRVGVMTAVGVYHSPYLKKGLRAQLLELDPWLQIMALPFSS